MTTLALGSCAGTKIGVKGPGRCLRDLEAELARHGGDREAGDLSSVRDLLSTAAKLANFQPSRAVGHYFQAAEEARQVGGGAGAEMCFAHAIGQATALVHDLDAWEGERAFR